MIKKKSIITVLILVILSLIPVITKAEYSSLIHLENGKLVYNAFDENGNKIPDFSNCGYMGGGVTIPDVPVVMTISPLGGGLDDTENIQRAIDAVSDFPLDTNGFRGALLLKAGTYLISDTLRIEASGVVLRGEGQEPSGTVIKSYVAKEYTGIVVSNGSERKIVSEPRKITDKYLSTGSKTFSVSSSAGYSAGDDVVINYKSKPDWITYIGMNWIGEDAPWNPDDYDYHFERKITAIDTNKITVDIPMVTQGNSKHFDIYMYKYTFDRINKVGLENFMIDAFYSDPDPDSVKKDNYHLRTAISLEASVEDSWVRKVTAKHLSNALVNIAGKRCTVQECTYLEPVSQISGGFRYPFYISAGQMNLVEGCFAENGRHDFVMGAKVPGPNVFYNSKSMYARNLSEPHHRFSVGVLYDNISVHTPEEFKDAPDYKILGNGLAAFNRGNSGTGHGWSGNSILFWNTRSAAVIVSSVAGGRNFAIGVSGRVLKENGNPISQGYWIYWFKKHNNATKAPSLSDNNFKDDGSQFLGPDDVSLPHFELETTLAQPESLYKKQLEDRLGSYDLGFTRIDAEADSYTCDGFPDKNYNDMPEIHLSTKKYGIDSYNRRGYLRFKLDDSIKSEHISSAKLKVHTPMEMTRGQKVKLYEITDDSWEEETLTWNNQPPRSHLISCAKLSETGPGWYNYDVTGFIKSQYTGDGKASFSMVIDDFEALRNMSVDRRESLLKPHLEIRYEINPGKPFVEITSHSDGAEIPSVPYTISGTATDSSDIRLKISDVIDTNVNVTGGNWSYTVTDSSLNGAHYFVRAAILDGQGNLEAGDAIGVNYPSEKSPLRREILEVSKDAYVRAGVIYADKNYGSEPTLEVKDSPTDYVKRISYLNFDLSGIDALGSAKLRIYGNNNQDSKKVNLKVFGVNDDCWDEMGIKWNNRPSTSAAELSSADVDDTEKWYEFDVTGFALNQLYSDKSASFALQSKEGENRHLVFDSREGKNTPVLIIEKPADIIEVSNDAYVRAGSSGGENYADTNYGGEAILAVKDAGTEYLKRKSYLKFDISSVDINSVGSAKIRVYGKNDQDGEKAALRVFGVNDNSWQETGITWNNSPLREAAELSNVYIDGTEQLYELDVTSFVRSRLSAGQSVISLVLECTGEDNKYLVFDSREGTRTPELVLNTR